MNGLLISMGCALLKTDYFYHQYNCCIFFTLQRTESNFLTEEDETNPDMQKVDESLATPEAGFVDMLRCGILALQMLPENSSSGNAFQKKLKKPKLLTAK